MTFPVPGRSTSGRIRRVLSAAALLTVCGVVPTTAQSSTQTATDTTAAPVGPRMTALVREALGTPGDSAVWSEMATLLPELARDGEAGVLEAFEAARVADSLSTAPYDPMALALESGRRTAEAARTRARPSTADATDASTGTEDAGDTAGSRLTPILSAAAGVAPWTLPWMLVAALVVATRRLRKGHDAEGRLPVRAAGRGSRKDPRGERLWAVSTLAASGLPPSEIARRTGMAQDAVRVLMEMGSARPGGNAASGASRDVGLATGGAATRPRTQGERAAGMTAERVALRREARGMRDGRITYGPRTPR